MTERAAAGEPVLSPSRRKDVGAQDDSIGLLIEVDDSPAIGVTGILRNGLYNDYLA
jgi:hypothetical protein